MFSQFMKKSLTQQLLFIQNAAYSFFLHKKLSLINSSVDELRPIVNQMQLSLTDIDSQPINNAVNELLSDGQAISTQV